MKGLAALLGAKVGKSPFGAKPSMEPKEAPEEEAEEESEGGSEMEFFKLASEASEAGDHEAAAKAFKSGVKACMSGYGGKE